MTQITVEQCLQIAFRHHQAGQLQQAEALYRQILDQQPNHIDALHFFGVLAGQSGRFDIAVNLFRRVIVLQPNFSEAYNNLGIALRDNGQLDDAIIACRQAIALKPNYPEAHYNLGVALQSNRRMDEAIAAYRQALALKPDNPDTYINLGNALKDTGQLDEAIACYRRAVTLRPQYPEAHSNLLLALPYHPDSTPASLLQESRNWALQHAESLKQFIKPHSNDRTANRRLKIGYVSPDLWNHVVGRALLPLLERHDRNAFEIFCYAQVSIPDAMTQRIRSHVDTWRSIVGLSHPQVAQLIRDDRIDILMDLSGHTSNHRLMVFARKPAPVQVTWLGFPGTTGISAMDYRITDPCIDPENPPGVRDAFYTEQSIRLADGTGCYQPHVPTPHVNELPALTAGRVTFGCLNNLCKVSPATMNAWFQILRAVPQSDLLLYAHDGEHRRRMLDQMAGEGIDQQRLRFVGYGGVKYFTFYHQIDISLDPFPYTGSTTTCDSLWMGVPVVSCDGPTVVARLSLAILARIGLTELVAHTCEDYVRITTELAGNLPRLAELRSTLRQRMQASPLMDAPRFAQNMEAAYRQMWQRWCDAGDEGTAVPISG